MRIGIDVGGTNTDAVLVDGRRVLATVKASTTPDVTSGIVAAIKGLRKRHGFDPSRIGAVMIGTTQFINALIEGRQLTKTAALRLGLPSGASLPPLTNWPDALVKAMSGRGYQAHGGHEFDGRYIAELDPSEVRAAAADMGAAGIRSVAISSVFSPVDSEFEVRAAEIINAELPDVDISLSHEIGRIGLIERENATILNAALRELAGHIVNGLEEAVAGTGVTASIYLSQNDGTLIDVDQARRYPVATFASGPTNSMRGAAVLSGFDTCAVIDVGGTTTDIGVLQGGFPREATADVRVAGVRTNFRMPEVVSLGIGGGSEVRGEAPVPAIGPRSVGHRLTSRALVFGGDTLTTTDIAVAAGRAEVGDRDRVRHLEPAFVDSVLARIADEIADGVQRMRTSARPLPLVAVGGGALLLPDELVDIGAVHRPEHSAVANAIGAAIAQVGGEIDRVYAIDTASRESVIGEAKEEAVARAVAAGADPSTVSIVDFDEVPLSYLPGNATRIRAKAVGDLQLAVKGEVARHA
ncbi:hydantoinase/oxoprolinase N-terminal domain-containing protein [Streptomyces sp. AC512_CC834]|uniref:hydantoinase/oxoprolinase N-terminal domain-containing protein n=1 Tax=Streptomyces sp. AC512_CC834 TaxID=2823691 RepID=UPI001C256865|nr:hydantoinase/oxoprolinase family protein [Streptomyces sp. AC512_CC834]